jgi:AraC family transcriptional regulator of adaptative response/methylated-DNA-[protein]-cysteine methyltransferase
MSTMTLTPEPALVPPLGGVGPRARAEGDYSIVRRAIAHIRGHWRDQPDIDTIAEAAGVTPDELHHLFRRWCGLTPKGFLQALTLEHARSLLRDSASILDAAYEVGLSGPGRLHDLFVTHEAMSPGEWKSGGEGLTLSYGFFPSQFGSALVIATERGLCGLAFADAGEEAKAFADMKSRWPRARFVEDLRLTAPIARRIFDPGTWRPDQPLKVIMIGTDFEVRVWQTLLKIPMGHASTYCGHRPQGRQSESRPRGRRRRRQESGLLRGAVPPRHRQIGRPHRLSLGPDPQARHPGLGSRTGGRGVTTPIQ